MVTIIRLDHQGRGIAKINDKIIFIPNALVGEEVEIKIINEKPSYSEGVVLEYKKLSDKRVKPKCPYYEMCGGCDLMHMTYKDEINYKLIKVQDIIYKYAAISDAIKEIVKGEDDFYYRNKVVLKANNKLGYYRKGSNEIVNINECVILDKRINEVIKKLNKLDLTSVDEVIIKAMDQLMLIIKGEIEPNKVIDMADTIIINNNVIKGNGNIIASLDEFKFKVSNNSFFQVNSKQCVKLYRQVKEYLDPTLKDNVLDLYCGTGTIGIFVSKDCARVIGVEISKSSYDDALVNKKLNGVDNIDFINDDVNNIELKNINKIIIDPPRSGLDKKIKDKIIKIKPEIIVYISCDPMTMARDIKDMSEYYGVKEMKLFDMFPKTYHVETVALLEQKK